MGSFDRAWLDLRGPADRAARSAALADLACAALPRAEAGLAVDLACGAGANACYLTPRLPGRARWRLVDDDGALLAEAGRRVKAAGADVDLRRMDLASAEGLSVVDGCGLVTASALLDLVSDDWLARLVARCAQAGAVVLFALTYDGRIAFAPEDPDDARVRDLVNRHQRRDKGFGPALGPEAAAAARAHLEARGYHVRQAATDWALDAAAADLQAQLVDGWTRAAVETAPEEAGWILAWRDRRLARVADGDAGVVVGHQDLAAWMPGGDQDVAGRRR